MAFRWGGAGVGAGLDWAGEESPALAMDEPRASAPTLIPVHCPRK